MNKNKTEMKGKGSKNVNQLLKKTNQAGMIPAPVAVVRNIKIVVGDDLLC